MLLDPELVLPLVPLLPLVLPLMPLLPLVLPVAPDDLLLLLGVLAVPDVLVEGLFGRSQATSPMVASRLARIRDDDFMVSFSSKSWGSIPRRNS